MEKEKNTVTLRRAIEQLPVYEPTLQLWDTIEQSLDYARSYEQAVQDLPQYSPNDRLWQSIEQRLDSTPRRNTLRRILPYSIAAAAILSGAVLGGMWLWNPYSDSTEKVAITVAETQYPEPDTRTFQTNDDADFAEVLALADAREWGVYAEQMSNWKAELVSLTEAKNELQDALSMYGEQEQIGRELREIELSRSRIIKQIANQL